MIQTMRHAGLSIQDAAMLERDHGMKQLAHNSKTLHGSPRSAPGPPCSRLDPYIAPFFPPSSTGDSSSHTLTDLYLASVPTPANFNTDPRSIQFA